MASEGAAPPPYNTSYPPNTDNIPPPSYAPQGPYPPAAPPSYSSHDPSKAYPVQTGAPPFNPQPGVPPAPGYAPPGYPVHGAAPGYTTQAVGVNNYHHTQTTVITQQPTGGVILHATAPPPDYMAVSIISMFCCVCIGVFAVLKSVKSRDLYRAGDHAGALAMGLQARKLAHGAIIFAVCFYVVIVIIRIVLSAVL